MRLRIGVIALAGGVAVLSGCAQSAGPDEPDGALSHTTVPAPVGDERGSVVAAETVTDFHPDIAALGATAQRVTYRSTSGVDGTGAEVVATVFTPPGPPPEGGWPVVTVGHGTTGVTDECAPSDSPDLLGTAALSGTLVERGYVVTVSDYQGLGTDGPHPYLEPDSAAYDLIDAVRAARLTVPDTSTRWAALGISQGGQASWAAAERAADYGDGLEFVGAANLSPAADLSRILDGPDGVQLTVPQTMFLPYLIEGLRVTDPDLDPSAYLRGPLADATDVTLSCVTAKLPEKLELLRAIDAEDVGPRTMTDAENMRELLGARALPRQAAAGPLLVVVGTGDDLILPSWTENAVARACLAGDVVDLRVNVGERHADPRAVPGAVDWIADRFAGVPAPDTCGAEGPE
ncbi:lipase [Rhodococcus triatomae]|uniref:Secretory lipase n=1 Tax=Rhodococcus triatomae TaxID=300028 RepID=A0A1G8ALY0_9NOCA|nr:lipase family protein [Rhodococcus triatomae]QNG17726.1 lipase [Rhodococcus triatomae]QNG22607.1 lipase [Rhodococcus triatomae]SDH22042.1 Secretory lipase [Rhodococcus triatomae]